MQGFCLGSARLLLYRFGLVWVFQLCLPPLHPFPHPLCGVGGGWGLTSGDGLTTDPRPSGRPCLLKREGPTSLQRPVRSTLAAAAPPLSACGTVTSGCRQRQPGERRAGAARFSGQPAHPSLSRAPRGRGRALSTCRCPEEWARPAPAPRRTPRPSRRPCAVVGRSSKRGSS